MKLAGKMGNCLGELCLSASFQCNYTAKSAKSKILGVLSASFPDWAEVVEFLRHLKRGLVQGLVPR